MITRYLPFLVALVAVTCEAQDAVDPFSLPPVKAAMDRYKDAVGQAGEKLATSLKNEVKAATRRGELKAVLQLQELVDHLEQGNDPATFVAGGGGGLPQPAAAAGWAALNAQEGLPSIAVYKKLPQVKTYKDLLNRHVKGELYDGNGGLVVKQNDGHFLVPNQVDSDLFLLVGLRAADKQSVRINVAGSDHHRCTANLQVNLNGVVVGDALGADVTLPKGDSLLGVKVHTGKIQAPPEKCWIQCEIIGNGIETFLPTR
jgi:hypothetical protein